MKTKEEIEYEERVRKRVLILIEYLNAGKVKISEDIAKGLEESFSKIQFDFEGNPIIDTIDGRIRSMALGIEQFNHRDKMKTAISLYEIQRQYFTFIETNFSQFYIPMVKKGLTPHQVANSIAYGKNDISFLDEAINIILKEFTEFWELLSESAYIHLEDSHDSIKAVYGGDLFPQNNENIASKCGIYTDTIILPCPFIRSKGLFSRWNKEERVYYLLKLALNILQYKELALAELKTPIVCILPDKEMLNEFAYEQVKRLGEKDALFHASKIFGREFKGLDELIDFGKNLNTVEKVISEIKEPKRVLFDTEYKDSLKVQIENQISGESGNLLRTENPGILVSAIGVGRMSVCNELLMKSTIVRGIPLIDAPTSWEYFKWKLEYDSERAFPEIDFSKLHILKGLNYLSDTKLGWLGNIPPKALIELRKTDSINEIRSILSKGIDELVLANELDFDQTSKKVFKNLNKSFKAHNENLEKLKRKKWKIAGQDFGSWIVMGTIEMTAAYVGTPMYGLTTVVLNQILDAPKLKDIPKTFDKINDVEHEKNNLRKTPIGIMFNYK